MLSNGFKDKMLAADLFEAKKTSNAIKHLWQEAKDIEITLDFLQPNGIFGKFFKKKAKFDTNLTLFESDLGVEEKIWNMKKIVLLYTILKIFYELFSWLFWKPFSFV